MSGSDFLAPQAAQPPCTDETHRPEPADDCDVCWHLWFFENYSAPAIRRYMEKRRKPLREPASAA